MNKECAHCGMEIPEKAKICPYCKRKQPEQIQAWELIIGAIVVWGGIIVFVVNYSGDGQKTIHHEQMKPPTAVEKEYKTSHERLFKSLDAKMKSQQEDVKKKTANPTATTGGKVDKEINTVAPSLQATPQQTEEDAQQPLYTEEETNVEDEAENGFDTEAPEEPEIGSEKAETKKDPKQQRAFRKAMKKQIKEREKNKRKEMKKNN
ncbi:zinc ribbon domain-containing protein [Alistipes sp. Z76]|nr:zinc ribbon domain-containing protein [Alistipes sp. Z76]